eukprot:m.144385 g.144385  ORF g.144385 m.144385 type:complete len:110 (+) comp17192_c0_seq4:1153-1482(+)
MRSSSSGTAASAVVTRRRLRRTASGRSGESPPLAHVSSRVLGLASVLVDGAAAKGDESCPGGAHDNHLASVPVYPGGSDLFIEPTQVATQANQSLSKQEQEGSWKHGIN